MKASFICMLFSCFFINYNFGQIGGCTPSGQCNGSNNHLDAITFGTVTNANPGCSPGGYGNYTATDFFYGTPGESYVVFVDWASYNNHMAAIWIDWNDNNSFADDGEPARAFFSDPGVGGSTVIQVPEGATPGDTLYMRVGVFNNQGAGLEDPCNGPALAPFREVEDYSFVITSEPPPPTDYCIAQGNDCAYGFISNVNLGGTTNPSNCGFYQDNTANVFEILNQGSTTNITVTRGGANGTYNYLVSAWIDFNNDFVFSDVDEMFSIPIDGATTTHSGTITVPVDAPTGMTRMRIRMTQNAAPTSCGPQSRGEVEDYKIYIGDPVRCVSLQAPADEDFQCTKNVTFTWTAASSGPTPVGYKVFIGTDVDATNIIAGQDVGTNTSYTHPTGLAANTLHYWRVIAYDDNGDAFECETRTFTTNPVDDPVISGFDLGGIQTDSASVCQDSDLQINATITNGSGPFSYEWIGDVNHLDATNIVNPNFNAGTSPLLVQMSLIVMDDSLCVTQDSIQVFVKPLPIYNSFTTSTPDVCPDEEATINLNGANGIVVDWLSRPLGFPFSNLGYDSDNLVTTIVDSTEYKAILSLDGCLDTTNSVIVNLKPAAATPNISVLPGNIVCEGDTVILTSSIADNIEWNDANSSFTEELVVTQNGLFHVTHTDATTGCSSVSTDEIISFNALPDAPIFNIDGMLCEGETVTLSSQYSSNVTWFVDDLQDNTNAEFMINATGKYKQVYIDINTNCSNSTEQEILFDSIPNTPTIEQIGDTLVTNPLQLVNWYDNQGNLVHTGEMYIPNREPNQTFTAKAVSEGGCSSDVSNEILYDHTVSISEFNSFTFELYPNPVKNVLYVNVDIKNSLKIAIRDISGRMIKQIDLTNGENKINVEELEKGVYFITHSQGETINFIKE